MTPPPQLESVRRSFSRASATYERHAHVQAHAADRVLALCDGLRPRHILETGCGTGLLTRLLVERFPRAPLDALDLSASMIARARQNMPKEAPVAWHVADVSAFCVGRTYDLVVSNCSLHWTAPIADAFRQLHRILSPGGHLIFSLMLHDTFSELHEARQAAAPSKLPAARLPGMDDVMAALRDADFALLASTEERRQEYVASAPEFLRVIHDMGLTGGRVSRSTLPLTRGDLERLIDFYERRHRDTPGLRCTYHLGYVHALKT